MTRWQLIAVITLVEIAMVAIGSVTPINAFRAVWAASSALCIHWLSNRRNESDRQLLENRK